jgi:hypothetical protein
MPTCQGPNCSKQDYENRSETLTRSSSLLFGSSSGRNADATGERERKGQREMEHEDVDTSGAEDTPNNNEAVMRFLFSKLYFDSPERFN